MSQVFSILIIVGGGLGTFLLGMKHLSEGLQAVSGSGLRRFMSLATTHRLAGVGTGVITTVIVQSSSIITVMAVGFVSSGLMNLSQAINVIIGSNIGTTATAWLIAFAPDVKMLGLCVVLVGAALYFFQRNERLHNPLTRRRRGDLQNAFLSRSPSPPWFSPRRRRPRLP